MSKLISKDFPNIGGNYKNYVRLGGKAVLASKNKDVDDLNIKIQSEIHSIKSIDSILPIQMKSSMIDPTALLNSLDLPKISLHNL